MAKFLTRLVLVLIGLELAYLVLINVFLSTTIGPAIVNLKPEKFQLQWDSGWSVIPGLVNARGVKLRVQTPRMQWYLEVDGGNLWVRWWKLPLKHFEATGIEAEGLSFYLRHRLPAGSKPAQPDLTPAIPGLTNPPQVSPSPPRGRPWHILIESSRARHLKEFWVEQFRVTGHGESELELGRYSIITRGGPSALSDTVLELGDASLAVGKDTLVRDLRIKAKPTLDPIKLLGATPGQVAAQISGTVSITGRTSNLEALNLHFPGLPIRIENDSEFDFAADIELDHGALVAGSNVLINAQDVTADYLQYQVKGAGVLRGEVSGQGEDTVTRLELALDKYILGDREGEAYLIDNGFQMAITVNNFRAPDMRCGSDGAVVLM